MVSIEPLLYKTLYIVQKKDDDRLPDLPNLKLTDARLTQLIETKPPWFFSNNIKSIEFLTDQKSSFIVGLLSVCTGVQNLRFSGNILPALYTEEKVLRSVNESIIGVPLRTLEIDVESLNALSALHHSMPNLVALVLNCGQGCLLSMDEDLDYPRMDTGWLPNLVHIKLAVCRSCERIEESVQNLLSAPKLEKLRVEYGFIDEKDQEQESAIQKRWKTERLRLQAHLREMDTRIDVNMFGRPGSWPSWLEYVDDLCSELDDLSS